MEGHIQNSENDSKVVHERSNTKIGIIKKSIIRVQFNSRCLYYLVCYLDLLLEVIQGLHGGRLNSGAN